MAKLAIKGHPTRGKEVIEILEMLGGKNKAYLNGTDTNLVYYICSENYIDTLYAVSNAYIVFTLEEFLEKYPYKVGDRVKNAKINDFIGRITNVRWDDSEEQIIYVVEWDDVTKSRLTYFAKGLQSYKEETMENKLGEITLDIPDGYEFFGINDDNKVVLTKKQPQYPKTYEEGCRVLNLTKYPPALVPNKSIFISQYKDFPHYYEIQKLAELLICRDAYWKIAGEQMGLGKPWEPDWKEKDGGYRYCIRNQSNKIVLSNEWLGENYILSFPTAEMRDTFYKNFKDLIEECKEFL